jgi:hypothetical protein
MMKRILTISVAAGALMTVASAASAQSSSECVNGYRWINGSTPVTCDVLAPAFAGPPREEFAPPMDEPMYTGSITRPDDTEIVAPNDETADEPVVTGSIGAPDSVNRDDLADQPADDMAWTFAPSREECQPGQYYLGSGERPVAC